MSSISGVNSAALMILQQATSAGPSTQPSDAGNDILKTANGVSGELSEGSRSGASIAGKFALDSAQTAGKIVIGDLGTFDTWDETVSHVQNDKSLSAEQKNEWLAKLADIQKMAASADQFRSSDLYAALRSGEFGPPA